MTAAPDDRRLFLPCLDASDMVMCCPAETTLETINREAAEHGLRYPLFCDPLASISNHVAAMEYAPASARFGPFVDNIPGMNWELKSGTLVRVGERVIKSTTGYDLLRFLLHSDGRYGRATSYVLRLRPLGGETICFKLTGSNHSIENARRILIQSPWVHWIDRIDLFVSADADSYLQIGIDCIPGERSIFHGMIIGIGEQCGTEIEEIPFAGAVRPPELTFKTTVSAAPELAGRLVASHGGHACVLCVNGVVFFNRTHHSKPLPASYMEHLAGECELSGGHAHGLQARPRAVSQTEASWADALQQKWNEI